MGEGERDRVEIETLVIHGGQAPDPVAGSLSTPIYQASTYARPDPDAHPVYDYGRTRNPTRDALEACVAALEGATDAVAFGSGMAAAAAVMQTLPAGARVVVSRDLYGGSVRLFTQVLAPRIQLSFRDLRDQDPELVIPEGTALVWLESPTNPLLRVLDIAAIAARCAAVGAVLAVDNTFATPVFQQPLALGAHVVVHSSTKYLNGHSDVVGGLAVTSEPELAAQLRFVQNAAGAVPGPFDAWLTLRGIKTLAVRMDRHQHNALAVARYLADHPGVERVHHPALPGHPGAELARRQMRGFGGVVSFELAGGLAAARRFAGRTRLFTLAESLGGVESLIGLPALMSHHAMSPEDRHAAGIVDGLVRLSVGIEHADDLLADLERALPR